MKPAYRRPAGAVVADYPLPPGFTGQGLDSQGHPVQGIGFNKQNQLIDGNGNLVLDASMRPISNPAANLPGGTGHTPVQWAPILFTGGLVLAFVWLRR